MKSLNESVKEYKEQLNTGEIQLAYKGIMGYMKTLMVHLKTKYSEYSLPANFYQGYMDMSYFSFTPKLLADRKLKIAIVFLHEEVKFEAWLCGVNKKVQNEYWNLINDKGWHKYSISPKSKNIDSIIKNVIVESPDFNNPNTLTRQIEVGVTKFSGEIVNFLVPNNK